MPSIIVMAAIYALSSVPGPEIDAVGLGDERYHINGHFFLFVVLCISYYYATGRIALSVVMTAIFGIFDEIHQTFTPFRSASSFDIWVDIFGGIIGGFISWKFWRPISQKLKNLLKK